MQEDIRDLRPILIRVLKDLRTFAVRYAAKQTTLDCFDDFIDSLSRTWSQLGLTATCKGLTATYRRILVEETYHTRMTISLIPEDERLAYLVR